MSQLINKMSAKALSEQQGSSIQYIKSPKTGKLFFVCGDIQGYVAPSAIDATSLSEVDFAISVTEDGRQIPVLFAHTSNNVIRTLS